MGQQVINIFNPDNVKINTQRSHVNDDVQNSAADKIYIDG